MKIGIDASRANKVKKTGVEWYSYHLIEELKKMDRVNHYFLYTNEPLRGDLAKCPENFEECVLKWPIPRSWTVGRLSIEMKFGKHIPDVLFVPAHTIPLLNPARSIVTIHDIGFEHMPEAYHWANKLYHKLIIQIIKLFASKIIAVSKYTKDDVVKTYKIPAEKIAIVYNGYDHNDYKIIPGAKAVVKDKLNIDYPYILYVGRLELKKNIVRLVEAFAQFKKRNVNDKHKLVLVGTPGIDSGLDEAKTIIKQNNLEKDVVLTGWLADEMLPVLYNAADLFIFPSLFEGFGIPVIEAMACGCPVICSNTTSLPEVAGDAALLFNPEKVDEIVSRMEQVILNEAVQESLKQKGLRWSQHFSWEECAKETLKILTSTNNFAKI